MRGWTREIHIVQPKLLVLMGEQAVDFVNGLALPARRSRSTPAIGRACSASRPRSRRWSRPTSTRRSTSASAKTALLERVQGARPLVGGAAAVLSRRRALCARRTRATALVLYGAGAGVLPSSSIPWDVAFFALVLVPATLTVVWLVLPAASSPAACSSSD